MSVAPISLEYSASGHSLVVPRVGASALTGAALLASVVFINEAVFRQANVEQFAFDWQVALRLALCGVCGVYGAIHLRETAPILLSGTGMLVAAFGCWVLLTVPTAVSPFYSAAACGALWCIILFAAAVRRELDDRLIIQSVIAALLAFLAGSWVVYYAFAPLGHELQVLPGGEVIDRFGGLAHPNALGRQATLTIAMLLVAGIQRIIRWPLLIVPLLFAGLTMLMTDSRTALIAAAAVVLVAILRSMRTSMILAAVFLLLPLAATALIVALAADLVYFDFEAVLSGFSRSGDTGEIYSMTGRTEVWVFVWNRFAESPWFGYGHGCSRFIMEHNFFPTHHAHNLLLNVLLSTGVMGGLLLLMQMGVLVYRHFAEGAVFPGLLLTAVAVGGLADTVMLGPIPDSHTVLWLLALFWAADRSRRSKPSHEVAGGHA